MRLPWRVLLLGKHHHRHLRSLSTHFHFHFNPNSQTHLRSLTSLLHTTTPFNSPNLAYPRNLNAPITRFFSSEPTLEPEKDPDHEFGIVADIFSKPRNTNDIAKELESSGIVFSHEMVLKVLGNLESSPEVALRFFDWVLESDSQRLSSKSYNLMLGILGSNGFVKEFWGLVETMKKKGYGVSKRVHNTVLEKFEQEGLDRDAGKLRVVFASGSIDNSTEKISSRVCKIIRNDIWGDSVESKIQGLNVEFSSDLVKFVLENLGTEPNKALIFFRWIEESNLFKHNEKTYNAMAMVLGREDCIDRFWKVVDEMRTAGYEMEKDTYVSVLDRFWKRKMVKDAVALYDFAMGGGNKPSVHDFTFLLRKIVVSKELDMGLFFKAVRVFRENGNVLSNSMVNTVLKALKMVGRFRECNKVLKAMEENDFVARGNLQSKIVFQLSSAGRKEEASEFMDNIEASGGNPDHKTWASLIDGYCIAGDLEKASDCFHKMVDKEGASCSGNGFELLVNAYCKKNRAIDASKLLCDLVNEKQLKPWHTTYKVLINSLLVQGGFKDALNLLGMMKSHGYPPFVDPIIECVSKSGTADDAVVFLKAMTVKRFPSSSVFMRLFEAFFQAGRQSEAQDFLSKCPGYIRTNADVLNLFCSIKSVEGAVAPAVAA